MNVSIHWRPTIQKSNYFASGTWTELECLKRAFGKVINKTDEPALRAMTIATNNPFYDEVADTVERVGEIEFWGEF